MGETDDSDVRAFLNARERLGADDQRIHSHTRIVFSWRDRVRILFGRTVHVQLTETCTLDSPAEGVTLIQVLGARSTVNVDPLWGGRTRGGMAPIEVVAAGPGPDISELSQTANSVVLSSTRNQYQDRRKLAAWERLQNRIKRAFG